MSERTAIDAPLRFTVEVSWTEVPPEYEERTEEELQEHLDALEEWAQEHTPREAIDAEAHAQAHETEVNADE